MFYLFNIAHAAGLTLQFSIGLIEIMLTINIFQVLMFFSAKGSPHYQNPSGNFWRIVFKIDDIIIGARREWGAIKCAIPWFCIARALKYRLAVAVIHQN
jgi:hypothetical protein